MLLQEIFAKRSSFLDLDPFKGNFTKGALFLGLYLFEDDSTKGVFLFGTLDF